MEKKLHEEWTFLHWKCVAHGCKFHFNEFLLFAWNSLKVYNINLTEKMSFEFLFK